MASKWASIDVEGSPMESYVAVPSGDGPFPGVIVGMHTYGVDEGVRKFCDDLASEGFAALLSGYWAAQAGLPPTGSTGARQLQLACLRSALPWAIRELRLPAPPIP